ncbi:hypothetical protein [Kangiella sp. HZ709]|uniref:hypothetical protein n=1 Tax=Kangiella sp. HZ709 TaxID=2666328 RepID=UPI0012AFDCD7|nr:hypothetical protein [Kangiella sp. HZ709]MRX26834.1 hypothetical protein [Kangiella sp. HZ709]
MTFLSKALALIVIVLVTALTSCVQSINHNHKNLDSNDSMRIGTHGMLIFGDSENIYVSHLPLFNHPHDMQVIAKIKVNNELMAQLSVLLNKDTYLTLVPEVFDLNKIEKNFKFSGSVYDGHFERQGVKAIELARFEIEQLYENKVLGTSLGDGLIEYRHLPSKSDNSHFYYRVINGRPASDHIIGVSAPLVVKKTIHIKTRNLYAQTMELADALDVKASSLQNIYLEINELR